MSRVFLDLSMSLDGFISGPDGGDGGLHDWCLAPDAAEVIRAELLRRIGAIILGHVAFGRAPDGFDTRYHVPHFILTHTPLPSVECVGASCHVVTDGTGSALAQARAAAGDGDVCVAGGADVAGRSLAAGLLDEMQVYVAPTLPGGGLHLFTDAPPSRREHVRTVQSAHATHLTYRFWDSPRA